MRKRGAEALGAAVSCWGLDVSGLRGIDDGTGDVAVLLVSSRGAPSAGRSVDSVMRQDYLGRVRIVVLANGPRWSPGDVISYESLKSSVEHLYIRGDSGFEALPAVVRVSRLRNMAVSLVDEPYLCFLDDDNRWERDHLSSLMKCMMETSSLAVHSWRQVVDADGHPFVLSAFPWGKDRKRSMECMAMFETAGMLSRLDNIFRDAADASVDGVDASAVDMGAWLFDRRVFQLVHFCTRYSSDELAKTITEDEKLLRDLKALSVPVACTKKASLVYQLGGYSNAHSGQEGGS